MKATTDQRESALANILFNIVIPAVVLNKFSSPEKLGPVNGLLVGLAFPLAYGIYDFARRRQANLISVLGFVSILLTGSFGLMQLDGLWFAVKEAAIPLLIGLAILLSLKTRSPLVRTLLYNDKVIDIQRVDAELTARGNAAEFDQLLVYTTWFLASSFVLSAILNFVLAIMILKSPAGSPEFNAELGKMTALSYPVIVLPSMALTMGSLWHLARGIRKLTGLNWDAIFRTQEK